jgi:hypothetical protein
VRLLTELEAMVLDTVRIRGPRAPREIVALLPQWPEHLVRRAALELLDGGLVRLTPDHRCQAVERAARCSSGGEG